MEGEGRHRGGATSEPDVRPHIGPQHRQQQQKVHQPVREPPSGLQLEVLKEGLGQGTEGVGWRVIRHVNGQPPAVLQAILLAEQ